MTEYGTGDIVDITITGARVREYREHDDDMPEVTVTVDSDAGQQTLTLPIGWPAVTITRVGPPGWPPWPGDLWRTHAGSVFFAVQPDDESVLLANQSGETFDPDRINRSYGPLTLMHREVGPEGGERP